MNMLKIKMSHSRMRRAISVLSLVVLFGALGMAGGQNKVAAMSSQSTVLFQDFRLNSDGSVPSQTNGQGVNDPQTIIDLSTFIPSTQVATVVNGAFEIRYEDASHYSAGIFSGQAAGGVAVDGEQPGHLLYGLDAVSGPGGPTSDNEGEWSLSALKLVDGTGNDYAVSVRVTGDGQDALIRLGRGDSGLTTVLQQQSIGRPIQRGDVVGLRWDGNSNYWLTFNGDDIVTIHDTTHSPSTLKSLTLGGLSIEEYQQRVLWFGYTLGAYFNPDATDAAPNSQPVTQATQPLTLAETGTSTLYPVLVVLLLASVGGVLMLRRKWPV